MKAKGNDSSKKSRGDFSSKSDGMTNLRGSTAPTDEVSTPDITTPAFNPPVPNRAWTEMRKRDSIEALSEKEKRDLYRGSDGLL